MEELTENAEDIAEEGESKQSEQKLGKLQYKVPCTFLANGRRETKVQHYCFRSVNKEANVLSAIVAICCLSNTLWSVMVSLISPLI